MEIPLTPLEFARRTRRPHGDRLAVVDGDFRLTYAQFFDRCDRWSAALQALGVRQGDGWPPSRRTRRATGGVLRGAADRAGSGAGELPADCRRFRVHHQPLRRNGLRSRRLHGRHRRHARSDGRRASTSSRWKARATAGSITRRRSNRAGHLAKADIGEGDLLTINYTSGTTARPKGVMITHRNATLNLSAPCSTSIAGRRPYCGRCRCSTPTGGRSPGSTPPRDPRVSAEGRAGGHLPAHTERTHHVLCAAPTVLISHGQRAGGDARRVRRGVRCYRRRAARGGDHRADGGRARLGGHPRVRADGNRAVHHVLRAPARARDLSPGDRADIKARQGVELVTSGELLVVDEDGSEVPHDGRRSARSPCAATS